MTKNPDNHRYLNIYQHLKRYKVYLNQLKKYNHLNNRDKILNSRKETIKNLNIVPLFVNFAVWNENEN